MGASPPQRTLPIVLLGSVVITILVFTVYLPDLKIQFYDGWWYLIWAATMNLPRYLTQFFDPAYITQGYRPVQGMYIYILYHLFGFDPNGYHIAQIALHAANAVLLFLIILRLAGNRRVAFVTGILFAVLPAYSMAVFWHAVADPMAACFYLLAVYCWIRYLGSQRKIIWLFAFISYILALLSKEVSIFLPFFLYLSEWWLTGNRPGLKQARKYIPLLVMIIPYLWLLVQVQSHGEFTGQFGFRIGPHMLGNLVPYLAVLAYPLSREFPTSLWIYVWLSIVGVSYLIVLFRNKSLGLISVGLFAIFSIAPLTGFPQTYFETRYTYIPAMASAVLLSMLFDRGLRSKLSRGFTAVGSAIIAFVIVLGANGVSDASAELAETTRQIRVPFRDISVQHPSFQQDTLLYFVYTPLAAVRDFEGLFFLRYGSAVRVDGTNAGQPAGSQPVDLNGHNSAYVYYFDSTGKPIELPVESSIATRSAPLLPVRFQAPIVLEAFQVASSQAQPGKALVIILNWRATDKIEKDYAVFTHLVDETGNIVASYDAAPGRGNAPTSEWEAGHLLVDPIVLALSPDVPVSDHYRLEVGLLDPSSGKMQDVIDADGKPISTAVMIEPLSVVR